MLIAMNRTCTTRQEARRRRMAARLASADTPQRQIGAVADHLRAALSHVPPRTAEQIATDVITTIRAAIARAEKAEASR